MYAPRRYQVSYDRTVLYLVLCFIVISRGRNVKMATTRMATLFLAYTLLLCLRPISVASFAFTTPTPRATSTPSLLQAITNANNKEGTAQRRTMMGPSSWPSVKKTTQTVRRTSWARTARGGRNDDQEKPYIPGSGLRGIDTSNLTGTDKRDADWFERTAEREASGQLKLFEDPVAYIALFTLTPVVIGVWGVLNCYIPGFCAPN